ncbi:mucin-3A [Sebastes fasciatus]|uniref:mucin-3A n=1 Tax=Sebastes fasciatus TaxID=394691 RepID=UPI003D9DE3B8
MGLNGTLCELVEIDVEPATFNRTVLVNLVINKQYNVKYEDETSLEYKEFVGNFTNQMEKYYQAKKIANLKEVVVINISRGGPLVRSSNNTVDEVRLWDKAMAIFSTTPRADSVNVTHDVVLVIPNNASAEQLYNEDVGQIKEAVDGLVGCTGECPNFNATAPPIVTTTEADLGSVCEQFVKDPDVSKYYELVNIDGTMTCVTVCHSQHSDHKRCYNSGICRVYKASGPLCMCHNDDTTWYLNDDCSFPIHRIAFYAGLSGTLACLLVTVGVLTAFILRNKQRKKRSWDIKDQQWTQWLDEDFEWPRSDTDVDNDVFVI